MLTFASQSDLELELQALADLVSPTMSTQECTTRLDIPSLSLPPHVRTLESTTTVTVVRCQSDSRPYSDYSPNSSSPPTAVNSCAPSPTKEIDDENKFPPVQDRLKWRLASGFFAIFLGGWADGGKSISTGSLTCVLMRLF